MRENEVYARNTAENFIVVAQRDGGKAYNVCTSFDGEHHYIHYTDGFGVNRYVHTSVVNEAFMRRRRMNWDEVRKEDE